MDVMFSINSRFSHFSDQDEIFLSPDLLRFVTPPFGVSHLLSMLHVSNI